MMYLLFIASKVLGVRRSNWYLVKTKWCFAKKNIGTDKSGL